MSDERERRVGSGAWTAPTSRRPTRPRGHRSAEGDRSLGSALDAYLRSQGHEDAYLLGAVCRCWQEVVGADVAAHAVPRALRGDDLIVAVDHAGWVTQLAFLADQILVRLEEHVGRHVATTLKVTVRGRPGVD